MTQKKQETELYRTHIEHSANCYFVMQDGKIKFANRRSIDTFGYTFDEFLSEGFDFMEECIAPDDWGIVRENIVRRLKGEDMPDYELNLINTNKDHLAVIVRNQLVEYEGKPAIEVLLTDITDRKSPVVAQASVRLGIEDAGLITRGSLQEGLRCALWKIGGGLIT